MCIESACGGAEGQDVIGRGPGQEASKIRAISGCEKGEQMTYACEKAQEGLTSTISAREKGHDTAAGWISTISACEKGGSERSGLVVGACIVHRRAGVYATVKASTSWWQLPPPCTGWSGSARRHGGFRVESGEGHESQESHDRNDQCLREGRMNCTISACEKGHEWNERVAYGLTEAQGTRGPSPILKNYFALPPPRPP